MKIPNIFHITVYRYQYYLTDISHLDDVLQRLEKHLYSAADWNQLGLRLGLFLPTLNEIETDNGGRVKKCLRACLGAWLCQKDGVNEKGGPTMLSLIEAVKSTNNAVAISLEKELPVVAPKIVDVTPPTSTTPAATKRSNVNSGRPQQATSMHFMESYSIVIILL